MSSVKGILSRLHSFEGRMEPWERTSLSAPGQPPVRRGEGTSRPFGESAPKVAQADRGTGRPGRPPAGLRRGVGQASVDFRGNRYSVVPGLQGAAKTRRHRVGANAVEIYSCSVALVVTHRLAQGRAQGDSPHPRACSPTAWSTDQSLLESSPPLSSPLPWAGY